VFDETWRVVAIHYAGGMQMPRLNGQPGTYAANEGIRMDFVREALRQHPPDPMPAGSGGSPDG
jgi:hypothetical protein